MVYLRCQIWFVINLNILSVLSWNWSSRFIVFCIKYRLQIIKTCLLSSWSLQWEPEKYEIGRRPIINCIWCCYKANGFTSNFKWNGSVSTAQLLRLMIIKLCKTKIWVLKSSFLMIVFWFLLYVDCRYLDVDVNFLNPTTL